VTGELTRETLNRALDDMWREGSSAGRVSADSPARAWELAERASDEAEEWAAAHPRPCGAVLFPLEPPRDIVTFVVLEARANGVPVHPLMIPYGDPVQGPQPAACAREPHPDSPWHWDGRGTWWR
jgi:hypothetical protein